MELQRKIINWDKHKRAVMSTKTQSKKMKKINKKNN